MSSLVENVLPQEYIDYLIDLPEVKEAKEQIYRKTEGKVYFTVNLTPSIKSYLSENIGLNLDGINNIPMRWIKGDTKPHTDLSTRPFEKTYLAYLTDNQGELIVDGTSYPINKGNGYIFPEGLKHETVGTGSEPRLLLGPMSEKGISVGSATTINANGQTDIIYFSYTVSSGLFYKINDGSLQTVSLPITIFNNNTAYTLKVLFETDITLFSDISYFICGSNNIQFGSTSLNNDGTRPTIIIDGVSNYPGLIQNGTSFPGNGKSNIYVYNIKVSTINGSTLADNGGWIGHEYFGNETTGNYIINCKSEGDISSYAGGIVGRYAGSGSGALLTIIGCSSIGNSGYAAGGIVGSYAGSNGGTVRCEKCWAEGTIGFGEEGGGIFGSRAGDSGIAVAIKCYSSNFINYNSGGIFGSYAGANGGSAEAEECYSRGTIESGSGTGGIFGPLAGSLGGTTIATNCYSSGQVQGIAGGIYGNDKVNYTEFNCYVANTSWTNSAADLILLGIPNPVIGNTWVYTGVNQEYELNNMGYSPYSLTNIITTPTPNLNQSYPDTLEAGQTVTPAIGGLTYTILQITGGDPASYGTITIPNSSTGVLVTTSATVPGTYTIYVRSTGSYNVTVFGLIVSAGGGGGTTTVDIPKCCQPICTNFNQTTDNTQERRAVRKSGVAIAVDVDSTYLAINQNRSVNFVQPAFKTYSDYMTYLQSKYR